MFRRLFTLEIAALRDQVESLRNRVVDAEDQIADSARELLAINRHTASPGIWNLRSPV